MRDKKFKILFLILALLCTVMVNIVSVNADLNITDEKIEEQEKTYEYTITYKLNGGTNNVSNPEGYNKAKAVSLKNPTRAGYTFKGWYSNSKLTKRVTSIKKGSTGNKTLYAKWVKKKYTITYKLNGGKNSSSNKKAYYVTTTSFSLKNPTRKGYIFEGWYSDSKFTNQVTKIEKGSTGNKVLYAKWSKKKYTITYKLNGGINNSSNKENYYITTATFTLNNPTKVGYTFKGWYSNSKLTKKVTKVTKGSIGNKVLYAKWQVNTYTIKFNGNDSTSGAMTSKSGIKYNSNYTLKANTYKKKGYTFVGWNTKKDGTGNSYENKESIKNLTSKNKGTVTLYAQWVKNENASSETTLQKRAIAKAKEYLEKEGYSRTSLINRLVNFEGFLRDDATYAVDHCGANWNEQAIKKIESITSKTGYSYKGLKEQLEYSYFTSDEITYAMNNCKVDFKEQAVKKVQELLNDEYYSNISKEQLKEELIEYYYFTKEEAEYGLEKCEIDFKEQAVKKIQELLKDSYYSDVSKEKIKYELINYYYFTKEEAEYAVNNSGIDWNEHTIKAIKKILNLEDYWYDYNHYSDAGYSYIHLTNKNGSRALIKEILNNYEFTKEEIEYGLNSCGIDWNIQAVQAIHEILSQTNCSSETLISIMHCFKFTEEESIYGVNNSNIDFKDIVAKKIQNLLKESYYENASRADIKKAISYYKFSEEEIENGLNSCGVDWKAQAVKKIKELLNTNDYIDYYYADYSTYGYSYYYRNQIDLKYKNGSRTRIKEKLIYYNFTEEEIEYGLNNCGVDWNSQAVNAVQDILLQFHFSKEALISAMQYFKFTEEEITYGVNNSNIDFNEQAVKLAKYILNDYPFSYSKMREVLKDNLFTNDEAIYGADNCGTDWNSQAVKAAKLTLAEKNLSPTELIEKLQDYKFTKSEAQYGVENCEINWKNVALNRAKDILKEEYYSYYGYSYKSLISYLKVLNFPEEAAIYAADNVDADWSEQAINKIKFLLGRNNYSCSGLQEELKDIGFSDEAISYALKHSEIDFKEQAYQRSKYISWEFKTVEELQTALSDEGYLEEEIKYAIEKLDL